MGLCSAGLQCISLRGIKLVHMAHCHFYSGLLLPVLEGAKKPVKAYHASPFSASSYPITGLNLVRLEMRRVRYVICCRLAYNGQRIAGICGYG
ncbi:hypothetical protein Ancab_015317 [Ancistrocladus abbreviatus]